VASQPEQKPMRLRVKLLRPDGSVAVQRELSP